MSDIGQVVRALREDAELTQEELAERAGLSARSISDIERGLRRRLYTDTAEKLATALGLDEVQRDDFFEHARGRSGGSPDLGAGFRRRFVQWHLDRIEALGDSVGNEEQWYAVLDADAANLDVALRWADEATDRASVLRLAIGLWQYWQARGALEKGRGWLERGLVEPAASDPATRLRGLWGLAWLAYEQGDDEGAARAGVAMTRLAEKTGDPVAHRNAHTVAGIVALAAERSDDAIREFELALAFAQAADVRWLLATSHLNLGIARLAASTPEEARTEIATALAHYEDLGDERFRARCLGYLALANVTEGKPEHAHALYVQSLAVFEVLDEAKGIAEGLTGLATVAAATGDARRAAVLAAAAERLRETTTGRAMPVERRVSAEFLARASSAVAAQDWEAWWVEGRALRLPDAITLALDSD